MCKIGKGVTACYLTRKYGCQVIGVDLSERMIEYAKGDGEEKGIR